MYIQVFARKLRYYTNTFSHHPHTCGTSPQEEEVLFSRRDDRFFVGEQDCRDPRKICDGLIRSKERKGKGGIWAIKCRSDKGSEREGEHGGSVRRTGCARRLKGNRNALASFRYLALPASPFPFTSFRHRVFPLKSAISLERNFPDIRSARFRFRFLFCASPATARVPPPLVKLRPCERETNKRNKNRNNIPKRFYLSCI